MAIYLKNLKDIHKTASKRHKELLGVIHELEVKASAADFSQHSQKPILVEMNLLERFLSIGSNLMDLDLRNSYYLANLQDNIKAISRMKRASKILKTQLISLEKTIVKEKKYFEIAFVEFENGIKASVLSDNFVNSKNENRLKDNLKKILRIVVPADFIENNENAPICSSCVQLLPGLLTNTSVEEPETEANSDTENKRLVNHANMLTKTIEKLAFEL